jgi:hypothetical protein
MFSVTLHFSHFIFACQWQAIWTTQEILQSVSNNDTWQRPCLLFLTVIYFERKKCFVLLPGVSLTEYPQISATLTKRPRPLLAGKQCPMPDRTLLSRYARSIHGGVAFSPLGGQRSPRAGRTRLAHPRDGASSPRAGAFSPRGQFLSSVRSLR